MEPTTQSPSNARALAAAKPVVEPTGPVLDTPFNGALQPPEPAVSPEVMSQGSLLDTMPLDMPEDGLPQFQKTVSRRRVVGLGLLIFAVAAAMLLGLRVELNRSKAQNTGLTSLADRLQQQALPVGGLSQQLGPAATISSAAVTVNGSLVLAPSVQPSDPLAGQLYYDRSASKMFYYDGTGFVPLQGGNTVTNNVFTNSTVTNNYANSTVNNTFITNNSGVNIAGTPGVIPVYGADGKSLADSILSQSGNAVATSADTLQGNGAQGLGILTANTVGASGALVLQSGNSSTTGSGDVSIDVGSNVINGTVISNRGFETGVDNFVAASGSTVAQSTAEAHSGSHSLAVTLNGNIWNITDQEPFTIPVTQGHTYYFSAWIRAGSTGADIRADAVFSTNGLGSFVGGDQFGQNLWGEVTDASSGWTQISGAVAAPAGAHFVGLIFQGSFETANGVHYIDDVTVTDMSNVTGSAVNIGTGNAQSITIGNHNQVGSTTITGGGAGINLTDTAGAVTISSGANNVAISGNNVVLGGAGGTGTGVLIKPQGDSTNAFQVQNASGSASLINVDTVGNAVSLGVGSVASFGNTRIGNIGSCCNIGKLQASKFTTVGGGAVSSISAFIGWGGTEAAPNNQFQLAIYADNGSGTAPGAYIASTAVSTLIPTIVSTGGAWNTLPISATLSAGTTYWLAYWNNIGVNDSNNALSQTSPATGALYQSSATWASGPDNGMPAAYPAGAITSGMSYSMYASFSAAGPALVLGAGGLVTASGPVLFQDPTDSPTAFQVQDNVGDVILNVSTSDSMVSLTNLAISGHISTSGTVPGIAAGTAACTAPTVGVAGNDTSGVITITTGTGCSAGGKLATVTFAMPFSSAPHVLLSPVAATAEGKGYVDAATIATTSFDLDVGATPASSTTYEWNYIVIQ